MGADVVVQSLHKTLPAMTQTAVIHVCTEELVKPVEQALEIFLKFFAVVYFHDEYGSGNLLYGRP